MHVFKNSVFDRNNFSFYNKRFYSLSPPPPQKRLRVSNSPKLFYGPWWTDKTTLALHIISNPSYLSLYYKFYYVHLRNFPVFRGGGADPVPTHTHPLPRISAHEQWHIGYIKFNYKNNHFIFYAHIIIKQECMHIII